MKNLPVKSSKNSFTLVELITVIAIMAIVATISVPAYWSINRGAAMRQAEQQLMTACYLARQTAITGRQRVVMGFPIDNTYGFTKQNYIRENMFYRCFFLYYEQSGDVARVGRMIGKVQVLPKNIVFDNKDTRWANLGKFQIYDGATSLFWAKGIRFGTTGSIYWRDMQTLLDNPVGFTLAEGNLDSNYVPVLKKNGMTKTFNLNLFTAQFEAQD